MIDNLTQTYGYEHPTLVFDQLKDSSFEIDGNFYFFDKYGRLIKNYYLGKIDSYGSINVISQISNSMYIFPNIQLCYSKTHEFVIPFRIGIINLDQELVSTKSIFVGIQKSLKMIYVIEILENRMMRLLKQLQFCLTTKHYQYQISSKIFYQKISIF